MDRRSLMIAFGLQATLATLAVILIVAYSTWKSGIGLFSDSLSYVAACENLLAGRGFRDYGFLRIVAWPPMYPLFMLPARIAGGSSYVSGLIVNVIAYSGIIVFGIIGLRSNDRKGLLISIPLTVTLVFSYPIFRYSIVLLSDVVFSFLSLGCLYFVSRRIESAAPRWPLLIAAICAALSMLTRYIGYTTVFTFLLMLAYLAYRKRVVWREAVVVASIACIPPGLYLLYNLFVMGSMTGPRGPSDLGLREIVLAAANHISAWLSPVGLSMGIRIAYALAVGVSTLGIVGTILYDRESSAGKQGLLSLLYATSAFTLIYTGAILLTAARVGFDPINDRLLLPIFPSLFLSLAVCALLANKFGKGFLVAVLAIAALSNAQRTLKAAGEFHRNGAGGYSASKDTTIDVLADIPSDDSTVRLSNAPQLAYYRTGSAFRQSPRKHLYASTRSTTTDLESLKKSLEQVGVMEFVWFRSVAAPHLYTPEELSSMFDLVKISETVDGSIYTISLAPQP